MLDVKRIRQDFPILNRQVNNRPLVYLDNGATAQMPVQVMRAVEEQYRMYQANIHRGIHYLSEISTSRVEAVRGKVAEFIGAAESCEIVFTSGTTDSINIAARSFCDAFVNEGDVILSTELEHHSNFIPWQEAAKRRNAVFRVVHVDGCGNLNMEELKELLKLKPKIFAVTCVSNVIGTVTPVEEIISLAHEAGCAVLLDGAQAMKHRRFNVKELGCDFLCFSGHKIMAPNGVGVLYGRREYLEKMQPVSFGGGMVDVVEEAYSTYDDIPFKFEAGTQNIAGIIGLGAAIDYINEIGLEQIAEAEDELVRYTCERLKSIGGCECGTVEASVIRILGKPERRAGAVSFVIDGVHSYDAAKLLDQMGIAIRSGHHCAQPLLRAFAVEHAVRVTPAFYNTREEIDALAEGLERVIAMFG